jgi:hypothetical protein
MLENIQKFMIDFFNSACAADRASQKAMRDFFCVEVRGFAEFIAVNGKVYRYGFVSGNDERTRMLVRQMFDDDFEKFKDTVGAIEGVDSWEDVHGPELKVHFKNNAASALALKDFLPSPLPIIDNSTINWLRNIYGTVDRINNEWDSTFASWSDMEGMKLEDDAAARDQTQDDISHLTHMLTITTHHMLNDENCGVEDKIKAAFEKLELPSSPKHGQVEIAFATIASLLPQLPHDTLYTMLLLYLASSLANNTFSPLPSGAKTHSDHKAREAFLEEYYDTTTRSLVHDWEQLVTPLSQNGRGRPTTRQLGGHIPASTVKNFEEFEKLVQEIQETTLL